MFVRRRRRVWIGLGRSRTNVLRPHSICGRSFRHLTRRGGMFESNRAHPMFVGHRPDRNPKTIQLTWWRVCMWCMYSVVIVIIVGDE